jgi:hypothetical protein
MAEVAPDAWTLGLSSYQLKIAKFEFIETQVAERRMQLAIVEEVDVFKDFASCLDSDLAVALIAQFEFQRGKLSATALSEQLPLQLVLLRRPCADSSCYTHNRRIGLLRSE